MPDDRSSLKMHCVRQTENMSSTAGGPGDTASTALPKTTQHSADRTGWAQAKYNSLTFITLATYEAVCLP